jgi:large subunit ribosomal protein L9
MEIILKEDVIGLGYKHDIVNVKSGYGRNYLIPQGKGVIASESAKKMLAEELKQKAKKLEKIKNDAQAIADKLEGVALTITAKVSAQGTIYGSVNNVQIAEELSKLGFDIDRKLITIKDVKTVGEHKATVRLHKEISVLIPVTVVPDGPIAQPAPVAEAAPAVEEAPADEIEEIEDMEEEA